MDANNNSQGKDKGKGKDSNNSTIHSLSYKFCDVAILL